VGVDQVEAGNTKLKAESLKLKAKCDN